MESLMPFHGLNIIRTGNTGIPHSSNSAIRPAPFPPEEIWRWHYQQAVLRMLRASAGPAKLDFNHDFPDHSNILIVDEPAATPSLTPVLSETHSTDLYYL